MKKAFNLKLDPHDFLDINEACNIYWYDLDHNLLVVNEHTIKTLKECFGDFHNVTNKHILNFSQDLTVLMKENQEVIDSGKARQFFNRWKEKNLIYICVTIKAPYYDEHDKIAGVFGISHVISVFEDNEQFSKKLTMRESQCLTELIKGKTAAEIAKVLHISSRTVESHLESIKSKLNCNSKSELISKVFQTGMNSLIEMPISSEPFKPGIFLNLEENKK